MTCMHRRDFLRTAALATAGTLGSFAFAESGADPFRGLKMGLASYSVNKLSFDELVAALKSLGVRYVSLKDVHLKQTLSKEEIQAQVKKLTGAGITLMSCGVIYLKGDEVSFRRSFEYVKNAGAPTIVTSFDVPMFPVVEKLAKEFDLKVAIHNHGPGDKQFRSALEAYKQIKQLDARMGLCLDIGHVYRQGQDEVEVIKAVQDRLYDFHFKDYTKGAGANTPGVTHVIGQGGMNVKGILKTLVEIGYKGHLGLEYEKFGPTEIEEIRACYEAIKKILAEV